MNTIKQINMIEEVVEKAVREAAKEAVCEMASEEIDTIYDEIPTSAEYAELNKYFHIVVEVETDEFGLPTVTGGEAVQRALEKYVPIIRVKWYYPLPGMRISLTSDTNPFVKWDAYHGKWYDIKGNRDLERAYYLG